MNKLRRGTAGSVGVRVVILIDTVHFLSRLDAPISTPRYTWQQ